VRSPAVRLFVYGTLLDDKIQRRVFGRNPMHEAARLPGWRVVPRAVRGKYPGVMRRGNSRLAGALLRIDRRELLRADEYEDAPRLYRRQRVMACCGARKTRCWIYVPQKMSGKKTAEM
jgi:gamma-glutamylcyclotransferase (GGCT)/AIG2-like uncharacterized protein YtfP